MGKLKLEIFGRSCEIISFQYEKDSAFCFEFTEAYDGYIQLGKTMGRLKNGNCAVDIRNLECGEHIPRLILEDMTLDLPTIVNENGAVYPKEHSVSEIGEISLRERRLCRRVNELEARLDEITKKVFGTSIF